MKPQITMDLSDWEAMVENKVLLEKSLEREKDLLTQIDILKKEKFEDFQGLGGKVLVKTITTEISENEDTREKINSLITFIKGRKEYSMFDNNVTNNILSKKYNELFIRTKENHTTETYSFENMDNIVEYLTDEVHKELKDKLNSKDEIINQLENDKYDLSLEKDKWVNKYYSKEKDYNDLLSRNKVISLIEELVKDISLLNYKKKKKEIVNLIAKK